MQLDDLVALGVVHGGELGLELVLLGLEGLHAVGDGEQADAAVHHLVDHAAEQALQLGQALLGDLAPLAGAGAQAFRLGAVLLEEDGDRVGLEQLAADAVEDAALQLADSQGAAVGAVAALPVADAGQPVLVLHRVAGAAVAAAQQAGEEVAGPPAVLDAGDGAVVGEDRPGGRPGLVVDDAQVRGVGADPVRFRARAADAAAGLRVLQELGPIVDEAADIGLVVEDAAVAGAVAGDGAGGPGLAAGRRDGVAVEAAGDRLGAAAGGVLLEDAADHGGRPGGDAAPAAQRLAPIVDLAHHLVAVGQTAGRQALAGAAGLAAADLGGEVLQEERVHRALEADMQLVDLALGDGEQLDAGEGQPLVDGGDVLLVAAEPVERLGEDGVEEAGLGVAEQAAGLGPAGEVGAGERVVGIDADRLAAEPRQVVAAEPDLVVDRALVLVVAGVAGVDRGAHTRLAGSRR